MKVREWLEGAEASLRRRDVASPGLEAQLLAAHVMRVERVWLFAHPEADFNDLAGETLLQRREQGEPLAYILGHKEFYGRDFGVDPSVLIPRQESEVLIEAALNLGLTGPRVLDLGTGSGVLAITLKLERPDWDVTGSDISSEALTTASANARFHRAQVRFILSDGFDSLLGEVFDLIVSNPPYIARTEELPREVQGFEPDLALYAENNGLAFYQMLSRSAQTYLNDDGMLLVEIGYLQAEAVKQIFIDLSWLLVLENRDLSGVMRVLGFRYNFEGLPPGATE